MEIPEDVADLARSIAERLPVDWKSVEDSPDAAWRETVRELKVLSEIAAFHRHRDTDEPLATWGPFRLVERIGHGAYGDVYRAIDTRLDREVALKLVRESDTSTDSVGALVIEEARLLARLRHPSVVTIHGADRIDGRVGLWMELVDGLTLEQLLKQDGPMAPRDLAVLCVDVCGALDAVHQAGLLHRDIKAQNVMRDVNNRHVLMDFGAGRMAGPAAADVAGTPLYLAPELLHGAAASRQSDIYALGVLLFRLATGRYPFEGASVEELRAAHHAHARTDLASLRPDCPDAFVALVERALSERPLDRFASAGEMGDLAATMGKAGAPGARKGMLVWSMVAVLALAAALGSVSWLIKAGTTTTGARAITRLLWDDAIDLGGTTSADGRLLSFTDSPTGSPAVHDLRSGQTRLLVDAQAEPGETGRSAVSPDGRQVAYAWIPVNASAYGLRLVDTAGGRPRTLPLGATVQYVEPHAWSPDGRWIAAAVGWPGGSAVQVVSPNGTTARTVADLAGDWPSAIRVSPDGHWVVFHVQRQLFTARADGSSVEPIPAAAAATLLTWMPDGRLLFTRERDGGADVYALTMLNGRPVGEPSKVDAVGEIGRMVRVEMAVGRGIAGLGVTSSGVLIYGRTTVTSDAVTVSVDPASGQIGLERVGQPVAAYGVGGLAGGIRYSPDGTRMLWTPSPGSVTIREFDGRTRTIVPQLAGTGRLEWAPDGRSLVIAGGNRGKPGVFRVDLETGSTSPLLVGEKPFAFCLSIDGRTLYFERAGESQGDVIARDLQSDAERSVYTAKQSVSQLKLSRDGRQMAVMTRSSIDVVDLTARKVRLLAAGPLDGGFSGGDWAPDGRWFLATVSYGDVHPRAELWSIPAARGEPLKRSLAAPAAGGWMRPDGREFSMMRTERRQQVWAMENFLRPQ